MFDSEVISNITPKLLISILLCAVGFVSPLIYMPYGGKAEFYCLGTILIIILISTFGLYLGRTLVQSSRERMGQLPLDSMFQSCLWGAWIAALGTVLTIIPLPDWCLEVIAPFNAHIWSEAQSLLNNADVPQRIHSLLPLSLSPAHTLHWLVLHLAWISIIHLCTIITGERKALLWTLVILSPTISVVGIVHWLFDFTSIYNVFTISDSQQLHGFITPLVNPNHAASLLMLSGLLALGLDQHISQSGSSRRGRIYCRLSFAFSIVGLGFTSSRAAWLIYGFCLALWYMKDRLNWSSFKRILYIGSVFIFICIPLLVTYLSRDSEVGSSSLIKGRIWLDSFHLMNQSLPMGIGASAFGEVFTRYQSFDHLGWVSHPENIFLQRWIEAGFLGLVAMLVYGWSWFKWWQNASIQRHPIALSLGLGVTAVVLQQQYDFGIERLNVLVSLAIGWGLMWSYLPKNNKNKLIERKRKKTGGSRWTRSMVNITCLMMIFLILMMIFKTKPSQIRKVVSDYDREQDQVSLLEAFEDHPASAHIAIRAAGLGLKNQTDWLYYTHRQAPRWGTPLIKQARILHAIGEDRIAAVIYRQVLSGHPELRDLIFSDIFKAPLSIPLREWLPPQFVYSFYIQYRSIDITKANRTLSEIDRTLILKDSSVRSLYIRYLLPNCEQGSVLKEIFNPDLPSVKRELSGQSLNQYLLRLDLITIQYGYKLCNGYSDFVPLGKIYEAEQWTEVPKSFEEVINKRKKLGFFSLSKILKNSTFAE